MDPNPNIWVFKNQNIQRNIATTSQTRISFGQNQLMSWFLKNRVFGFASMSRNFVRYLGYYLPIHCLRAAMKRRGHQIPIYSTGRRDDN